MLLTYLDFHRTYATDIISLKCGENVVTVRYYAATWLPSPVKGECSEAYNF